MKNKVFKYIKFLISMVLILGLVAPSYASLSASDGSAFVTKAEFDSALADFNSRLTTFEAGINSKIDSQVTTYLDRNGIWNGKDIIYDMQAGGYGWGNEDFDDCTPNWVEVTIPKSNIHKYTKLKLDKVEQGKEYNLYESRDTICSSLPKSGLLIGTIKAGSLQDSASHLDILIVESVNFYPWLSPIENLFLDTKAPGSDFKNEFAMGVINNVSGWNSSNFNTSAKKLLPYLSLVPQARIGTCLFFVKKGDGLYLRNKLSLLPYGGTISGDLSNKSINVVGSKTGIGWNLLDFKIY